MSFFADLFNRGGFFMFPILGALLFGLILAAARTFWTRSPQWGNAEPALVIFMLASGLTGTFLGLKMALEAVAHASLETQASMFMAGLAVALVTAISAAFGAAALVAFQAIAEARNPDLGTGPGPVSWWNVSALIATLIAFGAGVHAISTTVYAVAMHDFTVLSSTPGTVDSALPQVAPLLETAAVWLSGSIYAGEFAMLVAMSSVLLGLFKGVRNLGIRVTIAPSVG